MKTEYAPQLTLLKEASEALIEKLGIAKASEFWLSLTYGAKDYTQLRKKLFSSETVDTLYSKIKEFEKLSYASAKQSPTKKGF